MQSLIRSTFQLLFGGNSMSSVDTREFSRTQIVTKRLRITSASVVLACALLAAGMVASVTAHADGQPAMHWGTFTKNVRTRTCVGMSKDALTYWNYSQLDSDNYMVIGSNNRVIVTIVCVPRSANSSEVILTAASDDSDAAEYARNTLREWIVGAVCFDVC